jgi:hypothetical protein
VLGDDGPNAFPFPGVLRFTADVIAVGPLEALAQLKRVDITRVGHHVQVLLEVGKHIDKQVRVKLSRLEKTMID